MTAIRVSRQRRIEMGVAPEDAMPKCDHCGVQLKGWGWEYKSSIVCRECYIPLGVCQIEDCENEGDPVCVSMTVVAPSSGVFQYESAVVILCYRHEEVR